MIIPLVGTCIVLTSLFSYQIASESWRFIRIQQRNVIEGIAYLTLGLVSGGLVIVFVGFTRYLRHLSKKSGSSNGLSMTFVRLSSMIVEKRSMRVFVIAAVAYGVLFGIISSTLVFQPGAGFSSLYGVAVPSVVPVVCCGPLGQMPQLVVYVTQQFALLIVPMNLILLFTVSWLVGLNASVASYSYDNRPTALGAKWIGGFGAIVGLFTVCPTCAGFFLLSVLGLGGTIGLALTLATLQGLFVAAGIPLLAIGPILVSKRLVGPGECPVETANSG